MELGTHLHFDLATLRSSPRLLNLIHLQPESPYLSWSTINRWAVRGGVLDRD
ncbi:hypothetical protein HanPSC8_Chr12g0543631 [Helianthus annuus]|nr:hypothetical protein HanPSC8_Chr12g0543631 [Helianthus annuus]